MGAIPGGTKPDVQLNPMKTRWKVCYTHRVLPNPTGTPRGRSARAAWVRPRPHRRGASSVEEGMLVRNLRRRLHRPRKVIHVANATAVSFQILQIPLTAYLSTHMMAGLVLHVQESSLKLPHLLQRDLICVVGHRGFTLHERKHLFLLQQGLFREFDMNLVHQHLETCRL